MPTPSEPSGPERSEVDIHRFDWPSVLRSNQNTFLKAIEEYAPEVLVDLRETVLPNFPLVTLFGEGSGCPLESAGGPAILTGSTIIPRGPSQGGSHAGGRAL